MAASRNVVIVLMLGTALLVLAGAAADRGATLSPGTLDPDHRDLPCEDCHAAWSGVSDEKCAGCHDEGGNGSGVGRHHRELGGSCADCHPEHRGRETDVALMNGHGGSGANCTGCHREELNRSFPDGEHWTGGCGTCHSTGDWSELTLRHDGLFPLRSEGHARAPCGTCHPGSRDGSFDDTSCSSTRFCHRPGTYRRWARLDDAGHGERPG